MRPIIRKLLLAVATVLCISLLVIFLGYQRFGSNPRLVFGVLESCEASVLKLVTVPAEMRMRQVSIFPEGLGNLLIDDTAVLESSTRFKTVVERGQGKFIYPAVRYAFTSINNKGVLQKEDVLCQYGGVQHKDGSVLSLRGMYIDLGPISLKNPFLFKRDGFQAWVTQGLYEWVELDDFTPTSHWQHFLDRRIKVYEWEG